MRAAYTVGVRPHKHLFDVTLDLDGLSPGPLELWLPSWTPGSYLIREYARHLQGLRAEDESGQPRPLNRVTEDSWQLDPGSHSRVRVHYSVYAFDLTVRTSHLDESHAYFNGASLFLTGEPLLAQPAAVHLDFPAGWKVETALTPEGEERYRAADYDALCDSPVHAGPPGAQNQALDFLAGGVPHRLAVWGSGNEDLPQLGRELAAIVEQAAALFGPLPYQRYLFLTLLTDRGRGGLEHCESATLLSPRFGFRPEKSRQEYLLLAAHELFHAWVVKRLRPRALTPYRYRAENLTRLLWFFEGFTSYYETLLCLRAKILSPARFLEIWGERITQLWRTPGRARQSLEEASLTAWIKFYRPDENSPNSAVSYYLKGSLVALALEGELRQRELSLDGLLRELWQTFGTDPEGLPEGGLLAAFESFAGAPLQGIGAAVAGVADPDFTALESLGLRLRRRVREGLSDRGGSRARGDREPGSCLGATWRADRPVLQTVFSDGPAEQAGLCPEDELLSADGFRLTSETLASRLEAQPAGTAVELAYFRRDELRHTRLTLGERPLDTGWLERVETPSAAQRRAFADWTGAEL